MPARSRPIRWSAGLGPSHGIWIALATFLPTFLAIVFGIPYLVSPPTGRSLADLRDSGPPTMAAQEPERGWERPAMPPVRLAAAPAGVAPLSIRQFLTSARVPEIQPAIPRSPASLTPPPIDTWARGPAFAIPEAAEHYAARMERVGFAAYVRQEDWNGTRWVVWIGNPG